MIPATVVRKRLVVVFLLVLTGLLVECGGRPAPRVSLARLVANQDAYIGRMVITSGTVRSFLDATGRYYVIEDAHQNRVELFPASRAAPCEGRRVEATGKFGFDERTGRFIAIEEIMP